MASVVKIEDIQRDLQAVRDDVSRLTQQMTASMQKAASIPPIRSTLRSAH